jgi:hypothetical protein
MINYATAGVHFSKKFLDFEALAWTTLPAFNQSLAQGFKLFFTLPERVSVGSVDHTSFPQNASAGSSIVLAAPD